MNREFITPLECYGCSGGVVFMPFCLDVRENGYSSDKEILKKFEYYIKIQNANNEILSRIVLYVGCYYGIIRNIDDG